MSHLGALDTPTTPTLPPFPATPERRRSARLPLAAPVKVGPPQGPAQSTVSATDLSAHGLFIDADRPVRVGARFSLEIPLPDGERVYIAEAEVAYNRARAHGSGFGVRFIAVQPQTLLKIARAIEPEPEEPETIESPIARLTVPKYERAEFDSESPTLAPSSSIDLSCYPEPEILAEALASPSMLSDSPPLVVPARDSTPHFDLGSRSEREELPPWRPSEDPITDRIFGMLVAARGRFAERARNMPRLWTGLCAGGGLTLAAAIGLTLYSGSSAEAVPPNNAGIERGVSDSTHQALMGRSSLAEVEMVRPKKAEAASSEPRKNPLPPLVVVDEPKPAPVVAAVAPAAAALAPAPTPVDPAPAPARTAPQPAPAAKVALAPEAHPAPAPGISERAQAILGGGTGTLTLGVDPAARVLKTYALKGPDRFVIDLVGQTSALELPAAVGRVRGVRAGKHPEYTRIVVDTTRPLSSGQVQKDGGRLVLTLHFD